MIISNKFMQYIEDTEPINDRLMYATIRGIIECNIICTYMPPAERQNLADKLVEEKEEHMMKYKKS